MIYLLVLAYLLFLLYRHWDDKKNYWSRRGIKGPKAEIGFGNINSLRDFNRPRSLVIRDWTKEYGKVYGFHDGYRKILVISDLEMMNEMLVKKFDHFTSRIRFPMQGEEDTPKTNLVESRGIHWKRLRALASYAFTNKALRHIEKTVEDSSLMMIEELKKREGEVNMLDFYQEFTLDVISKIALGQKDVKMFNNPLMELCRQIFSSPQATIIGTMLLTMPIVKKPLIFTLGKLARFRKHPYLNLLRDVEKAVEQRKKDRDSGSPSSGDFIDIFLDSEVESSQIESVGESKVSRKLVFDEIVSQCIVMLLAGFETTANSLSYLTHFLANHPDVQEKIHEEIESVCPNDSIEYEELAELKYTEAAIKESLRFYPLASFVVSRECQKEIALGGIQLQKGDNILTDTWSMHMDKEIWGEDAEEFRPERWLEESSRPRVAFQSFGEGPRMCIGMRLAFMEEKTAIAHILKNFIIKKTINTNPIKLVGSMTVAPERIDIVLEKRK